MCVLCVLFVESSVRVRFIHERNMLNPHVYHPYSRITERIASHNFATTSRQVGQKKKRCSVSTAERAVNGKRAKHQRHTCSPCVVSETFCAMRIGEIGKGKAGGEVWRVLPWAATNAQTACSSVSTNMYTAKLVRIGHG